MFSLRAPFSWNTSGQLFDNILHGAYGRLIYRHCKLDQEYCYTLRKPVITCNYIFKVNSRNTRERCEICTKLTIKAPDRRHWFRSGVFIFNFERISHLVLALLLLTLSR